MTDFKRGFSTCNFGEAPQVDMSTDPYQAAIMTSCDSQLLNFERLLLSFLMRCLLLNEGPFTRLRTTHAEMYGMEL